ncbi:MAG: saccharopine dehydrogenase NADP-binding domain-containing protein [Saprospiraceae bacterium]|nr:saccharopine dehydrogenase NADP-binding domain-containing protein [Saprospiraceae bacterium]
MAKPKNIFIAGAGGIGRAVALMLVDYYKDDIQVTIGDISTSTAEAASRWIQSGTSGDTSVRLVVMPREGSSEEMNAVLSTCQVILDCLPGTQAPRIARLARQYHLHYVNLTEYVKETNEIIELAQGADTAFVLQTGLAPGFINILAHRLYLDLFKEYPVEKADSIIMRVGALPLNCKDPHFYGFTWSPVGVATEYLEDCIVVRNFQKTVVPALSSRENLIIDGFPFEADLTSGGAADLPDYFTDKVSELDYKTLRYPGHYDWVKIATSTIPQNRDKIAELQRIMLENIPMVEEDFVLIYSAAQGRDKNNTLWLNEKSYWIKQVPWGNIKLKAIQATTAAPMAEIVRLLFEENWKGVVNQSQIYPHKFMSGPFVKRVYGD